MPWCFTYVEKLDLVLVPFFLVNIYIKMVRAFSKSFFLLAYFFTLQGYPSFYFRKLEIGSEQLRARNYAIKASGNTNGDLIPIAPVRLQSPVGHFLAEILHNHPHLLPAALDKQLENLQSERDAQIEKPPRSSQDLLLYK